MAVAPELTIRDNPEERQFEAWLGDQLVGFAEYIPSRERVVFTHTVVEPEQEGRGIGSRLARFALDDVRSRGLRITPRCPFIRAYLQRHPEYAEIVDFPQPTETG